MIVIGQVDLLSLMASRRKDMQINVTTPVDTVDVNALDELVIDLTDLSTEFAAIPGQIAYWNAVAARFTVVVESARRAYERWYSPLYEAEFTELQESTGKKPNISSAENRVRTKYSDEYEERNSALCQAEADLKIVESMVTALEAKLQSLMQLAKRQNIEYDRIEPSVIDRGVPKREPISAGRRPSTRDAELEAARDAFRKVRQGGSRK